MQIKPFTHPREVFKALVNAEAEIEYARNYKPVPLPKYTKPPKAKRGVVGWYNLIAGVLAELKP